MDLGKRYKKELFDKLIYFDMIAAGNVQTAENGPLQSLRINPDQKTLGSVLQLAAVDS